MRSSSAGPRSGGRPGGGPARMSSYSAASAAKSGGSPASGGRLKAGPSAAKVMRATKSSVPSGKCAREFGSLRRGPHIETKRLLFLFAALRYINSAEHSTAFRSGVRCPLPLLGPARGQPGPAPQAVTEEHQAHRRPATDSEPGSDAQAGPGGGAGGAGLAEDLTSQVSGSTQSARAHWHVSRSTVDHDHGSQRPGLPGPLQGSLAAATSSWLPLWPGSQYSLIPAGPGPGLCRSRQCHGGSSWQMAGEPEPGGCQWLAW
jgi:hypothetical protein